MKTEVFERAARRQCRWHCPVAALREAPVNALASRDWTRVPEEPVVAYADQLESTSPGPLTNSIMLGGQRSLRNPQLGEVLRNYGYFDARGMGGGRKVVPLAKAASGKNARLEGSDDPCGEGDA